MIFVGGRYSRIDFSFDLNAVLLCKFLPVRTLFQIFHASIFTLSFILPLVGFIQKKASDFLKYTCLLFFAFAISQGHFFVDLISDDFLEYSL